MMNKLLIGSAMGFLAGAALMMMPAGKTLRQDMRKGLNKAKEMMQSVEQQ